MSLFLLYYFVSVFLSGKFHGQKSREGFGAAKSLTRLSSRAHTGILYVCSFGLGFTSCLSLSLSLSLSFSLSFFIFIFCSNSPILVITYSSSTGHFLFPSPRRHLGFIFLSVPQLPKHQNSSPHSHLSPSNISVWSFSTSVLRWKLPNSRSILLCIIW